MSACTCPQDAKRIPSDRRLYLFEPGAVWREGTTTKKDQSKIHLYHADCPVHGYTVVSEEEQEDERERE